MSFPEVNTYHFNYFFSFCMRYGITVNRSKKAKYTKEEVDSAISKWVKTKKEIPIAKELQSHGLPSTSVILKYYEDWKEPFVLYQKLYDKLNK